MYKIIKCIGNGSYGKVYAVKKNKNIFALKHVSLFNQSMKEKENLINEIRILKYSDSPYLLKFVNCIYNGTTIDIVTDLIKYGDLGKFIKNRNGIKLEENKIWSFFIQISMGIEYLHDNNIIHRDIKVGNIFLDKNDKLVIGDLGIARVLISKDEMATTNIGTPYYMSPELFSKKKYAKDVDIWALGCVLYELITFMPPFIAKNINQLSKKVIALQIGNNINLYKSKYSNDLINLIPQVLCDISKRPSISDILNIESVQNHKYLIPYVKNGTNIKDFYAKFKSITSYSWKRIIGNLSSDNKDYILPPIINYKKKESDLLERYDYKLPLLHKKKPTTIKPRWVAPTKIGTSFGKPPPLPNINHNNRYAFRENYKKIYNQRAPFIYN